MARYDFQVQGSAAEPYNVIIERKGQNLRAFCDCPAGVNGQYCKHRFLLLAGSNKGVVGGDTQAIPTLPELLSGTDVAAAMSDLEVIENQMAALKRRLSAAKKAVAVAMRN